LKTVAATVVTFSLPLFLSLSLAKEEEEEETLQTPTLGRLNQ
jgi:hypothetical protein